MKKKALGLLISVIVLALLPARTAVAAISKTVYPGGFPVALVLDIDGAVIDEVGFVKTAVGNASLGNKLKKGDTITEIDGNKVGGCDDIVETIEGGDGAEAELTVIRDGKTIKVAVTPYIESDSGLYKLGVYIRDTISGVGTVTYVKDNGFFCALGHKIVDAVAGSDIPISGGKVYDCEVLGVVKGKRNSPGELRATVKGGVIGEIYGNTESGIMGRFFDYRFSGDPVTIGGKDYAVPGKAYILTTLEDKIDAYEVEIIKASPQTVAAPKGMLIRVTDKRLLNVSGGIIQGMSGSPLMLGGKLIGAVTHVLINDPTKGYAIYSDWLVGIKEDK